MNAEVPVTWCVEPTSDFARFATGRALQRMRDLPLACLLFAYTLLAIGLAPSARGNSNVASGTQSFLDNGWMLQSSCAVSSSGEQISRPGFPVSNWHKTKVPSTVVAALVGDGTYPDPYFADNLRHIPGETYPIGKNFSHMPIPADSPFHCSWWYRTTFVARVASDQSVWLNFGGINNHANIWLNGHQIANAKEVTGAYRTYEFDITPNLSRDGPNVLAVETIAQSEKDLGINWVDWNPAPPDKDM